MMRRILAAATVLVVASCDSPPSSKDAPGITIEAENSTANTSATALADASSKEPQSSQAVLPSAPPARLSQQPPILPPAPKANTPRPTGSVYMPPVGSEERIALMNAIRSQTRGDLGGDATFVVQELRSNGEWAFAQLRPQWRDGRPINIGTTPIYRNQSSDQPVDSLNIEVIWRKERGRWHIYAHHIGATDVWWIGYCDRVPTAVLGAC